MGCWVPFMRDSLPTDVRGRSDRVWLILSDSVNLNRTLAVRSRRTARSRRCAAAVVPAAELKGVRDEARLVRDLAVGDVALVGGLGAAGAQFARLRGGLLVPRDVGGVRRETRRARLGRAGALDVAGFEQLLPQPYVAPVRRRRAAGL